MSQLALRKDVFNPLPEKYQPPLEEIPEMKILHLLLKTTEKNKYVAIHL